MLGDISPQTVRITQQAVVYPSRNHVTSLRVERFDGRTYKPVDMTAVTRVILSFPEADPVIVYDSSVQAVFTHVGATLTADLSDYAMPASVLGCQIILYDAEHPAGQVLVDDIDAEVQFDFRNVSPVGGIPAPAVDYLTDAPIDGVTYARKDGVWVPVDALVSGVSSVNGQSGVVVLGAADVGADAAGTGASQAASAVAAHVALSDPHPQYLTPAEGNTAYDAIGAAASAVGTHVAASDPHPQYLTPAEGNAAYDALGAAASAVSTHVAASDPHPQYNTQAEGDARYERNLTAGANITIDRTNPAAPVISASGGGGGGGAVDSVNGQTGVVVLDTDDIAEGVSNLYFTNGRAVAAAPVQTVDGQTGAVSLSSSYAPLSHVGDGGAAHSNAVAAGAAGFMTGADKTKLDGIAAGATANSSDAFLLTRGNHTGTQTASTISDFASASRAQAEAELVAGTNVTITPSGSGATRQLTIAAAGGGGSTNLSTTTSTTTLTVNSDTGTDAVLPAATPSVAGVLTAADKTKLDGIATGATANANTDSLSEGSTNKYFTEIRVLATLMTGLTLIAGGAVSAADSLLVAVGKLQKQINDLFSGKQDTLVSGTNIKTVNGSTLLGAGDLVVTGGASLPAIRAITGNETLGLANINSFGVNATTSNYTSTIPVQGAVAWTADAELHFLPSNTGDITITAAAGVSLNGVVAGSLTLSTQNGAATLKRTGADAWWLGGVIGTTAEQRTALGLAVVASSGAYSDLSGLPALGTMSSQNANNVTVTGGSVAGASINTSNLTEVVEGLTGTTPAITPTTGSIKTWTLSGNSTPTSGAWAAGQAVTLMIDDGAAYTINWSSLAVVWKTNTGTAPTLNTTGFTAITLWKVGTVIYGARVGDA